MAHGHGNRTGSNSPAPDDSRSRPVRRDTLRRTLGLYRPYRLRLAIVIALVLATAGLNVVPPLLIARIIDDVIPSGDIAALARVTGLMVLLTAASGVLSLAQAQLNTGVGFSVMRDLRSNLYRHLQRQPLSFFASSRTGDIQSRLTNDVTNTQVVLTDTVSNIVSNAAVVIASVIAMLALSWQLSLVALGITPVFVFFTVRVGRKRRVLTGETQRAVSRITAAAGETLSVSGAMLAKTFGREREQTENFDRTNDELTRVSIRQQMTGRGFGVVVQTFFGMAPALVWLVGGWLLFRDAGGISVGDIVAFTAIQARLLFPLAGLLNRGVDVTSSLALFERIFEYLDREPEIQDPENPVPMDAENARGEVEFQDVHFSYQEPPRAADGNGAEVDEGELFNLDGVSFTVPAGTLTALVGPSGSGKTTIGYLLARLYDVDSGSVRIDGVDVREMAMRDLARIIAVVSQDSYLFHASIADNLRYGDPNATDRQLEDAAKAAQIYDTITRLPEGFDTVVGERGYRLSGGERQRLAIARAILSDPRVLLLDEATSNLDTRSERLVQGALAELMQGRTAIAIAHRLSTIVAADQILVVQDGRITDRGRFADLIETSAMFRQLYEEQFTIIPQSVDQIAGRSRARGPV